MVVVVEVRIHGVAKNGEEKEGRENRDRDPILIFFQFWDNQQQQLSNKSQVFFFVILSQILDSQECLTFVVDAKFVFLSSYALL